MDEPGSLLFWAPALLGGGTLVLLGVFVVRAPQWLSTSLVGVAPLERRSRPSRRARCSRDRRESGLRCLGRDEFQFEKV